MKDFMSKEHYCYKIYTLLLKSSAYTLSKDNLSYMDYTPTLPPPTLLHNDLALPHYSIFQKSTINKTGFHTMKTH